MNLPKAHYVNQVNQLSADATKIIASLTTHCVDAAAMGGARSALVELRTLLSVAIGEHVGVMPELMPLQRAVNDVLESVQDRNQAVTDITSLTDEEALQAMQHHEDVVFWLDQARNAGMTMLAHLNLAIVTHHLLKKPAK